jgi:hypothetical protein
MTDRGVKEFSIQASVARAEAALAAEALLEPRGEIAIVSNVWTQLGEEREEGASLIGGVSVHENFLA